MGNPLYEAAKTDGGPSTIGCAYRVEVLRRCPRLKKLDGIPVEARGPHAWSPLTASDRI